MSDPQDPADESIGRPGPWGADRYHKPGDPVASSVLTPPGTKPGPVEPVSTPVTRKDYEFPEQQPPKAGGG